MKTGIGAGRVLAGIVFLAVAAGVVVAQSADATPTSITVVEHDLGSAVENRELKGSAERFPQGGQVYFWTRTSGGSTGDRIKHVWIRDGKEVSVGLSIGGSPWRTWSSKTLYPGSIGSWSVEARDADDNVLARREFECVADGGEG